MTTTLYIKIPVILIYKITLDYIYRGKALEGKILVDKLQFVDVLILLPEFCVCSVLVKN